MRTERLALKWIQKYVTAFGGDPDKVTMSVSFTVSKPSLSLTLRTIAGENPPAPFPPHLICSSTVVIQKVCSEVHSCSRDRLFPSAILKMGRKVRVLQCTGAVLNQILDYDAIVDKTGCTGSSDTLACLRTVSYDVLKAAVDDSPFIFDYQVCTILFSIPIPDAPRSR